MVKLLGRFVDAASRMPLRHILLLGLLLRLGWCLAVPIIPISDAVIYDSFARQIAVGHGYFWPDGKPAVYWAVGPSALYALTYGAVGDGHAAVAAINVAMGVGLIAAIHQVALARFGQNIARMAALSWAVWPTWIIFTTILSSELPANFLLMAGIACILSGGRHYWPRLAIGCLLLCASAYMRPTALPLIVAVPVLDAMMSGRWRRALAAGIMALAIAIACFAPWVARNQAYFGQPVLVSANFGANLWMGNNPASQGGYMPLPADIPNNEAARDTLLKERALEFIVENPGRYLMLCLKRVRLSFERETIGIAWNQNGLPAAVQSPLKILASAYWLVILASAAVGVLHYLWRRPIRLFDPLIASAGLMAAVPVLVVGMDRYHLGLTPFLAIFAPIALVRWSAMRPKSRHPEVAPALPLAGPAS